MKSLITTVMTFNEPKPDSRSSTSAGHRLVEKAQHQIDDEIKELGSRIIQLKFNRNSISLVSCLPPEMLSKIFIFHARADNSCNNLGWIKISHVCHLWRVVALECPLLWSSIIVKNPKWTEEMLRRSKNAPLTIRADISIPTPRSMELVQMALQHISRTKDLQLVTSREGLQKCVESLTEAAPRLQSLHIENPTMLATDSYVLPEKLLNNEAPCLRRLQLTKCSLTWDSPFFNALTHLSLQKISEHFRPTTLELVSILGKAPSLKTLDLCDSLPILHNSDVLPIPRSTIALPQLTNITISGTILECANLLNHLTLPRTINASLRCKADKRDILSELQPLLPSLSLMAGKLTKVPLRELVINSTLNSLRLQTWRTTRYSDYAPQKEPRLDLNLSWLGWDNQGPAILKMFCGVLPLTKLQTLRINAEGGLDKNKWVELFSGCTNLQMLSVRENVTHDLLAILTASPNQPQKAQEASTKSTSSGSSRQTRSQSHRPFLPSLRILKLEGVDFEIDEDDPFDESTLFEALRDCLIARSERKADIRTLIIRDAVRLFHEEVGLLQELVVHVDWDQRIGYLSGDEEEEEEDSYMDDDRYGDSFYGSYDSDPDYDMFPSWF